MVHLSPVGRGGDRGGRLRLITMHRVRRPRSMGTIGATLLRAGRRFVSSLPALFGVLVFTFLLMRVLPGDPAVFFASGPNAGKEEIEVIRRRSEERRVGKGWGAAWVGVGEGV